MTLPTRQWTTRLAALIEMALAEFRDQVQGQIDSFAVDCHPWNGVLDLAILTHDEVLNDPLLFNPAEMAAWKHYHFGAGLKSWQAAGKLASQMRETYDKSTDRPAVAEEYLRACAAAVATTAVQQSLSRYPMTDGFRIAVRHPDTDKEYHHG
jgi:hypothetical protein